MALGRWNSPATAHRYVQKSDVHKWNAEKNLLSKHDSAACSSASACTCGSITPGIANYGNNCHITIYMNSPNEGSNTSIACSNSEKKENNVNNILFQGS